MSTAAYSYDLDGAMVSASGEPFSEMRRHCYTRLPVQINGDGGDVALRYDSFGRRLHKVGASEITYRNGAHHPASGRTVGSSKGNGVQHALAEYVDGAELVYLFTPAGQSLLRRAYGYARVSRDHLRSVRVEAMQGTPTAAHYSAFGEAAVSGRRSRRGFAGYELDAENGLYNACRRLYAPWLRIFVSVDPRLQGASPYPYCGGDPFNRADPAGDVSSSVITSIVSALLMIAVVIATIVTEGAASETIPLAGAEMGSEGSAEGAVEGASNSLGAVIRSGMPDDLGSFSSAGAKFSAASSIVGNGAGLAAKAANGEHISAWQAIRGMLIEPVIAAASGGIGGAVAGMGLEAADGALRVFGWAAIGAAAGSLADSVANTAISGRLGTHAAWESIGIQMAVAVGEGVIMAPFFMRVRVRGDVPLRQRVRMGLSRLPIEYWEAVSEGLWVSSGTTDRSVLWAVPAEETTPLAAGMSSDWALDTGPLENQRASASSSGSGLGSGSRANSSSKTASPKSSEGYSDDYY